MIIPEQKFNFFLEKTGTMLINISMKKERKYI
jgi:hypothetical protein